MYTNCTVKILHHRFCVYVFDWNLSMMHNFDTDDVLDL